MFENAFNIANARRWQEKRLRVRNASGEARLRLLHSFGEEVRAVAAAFNRPSSPAEQTVADALDPASPFAAILGAWLSLDPTNPRWFARDRLFVPRLDDLVNACAFLAVCGFFPSEKLPSIVESVESIEKIEMPGRGGTVPVIPGIESPGAPPEEIPQLVRESALASARDKRRWREAMAGGSHARWLSPEWHDAPETWRTCVVLDATDAIAPACRALPARDREDDPSAPASSAAGLAAIVKTSGRAADGIAKEWEASGWRVARADERDIAGLHSTLAAAILDKPFAVVLSVPMNTMARRRASGLIGELSDEQFGALFGESLELQLG